MSRFILALDRAIDSDILKELSRHLHGVKIGIPLILDIGVDGVGDLLSCCRWGEVIFDLKLADVSSTMVATVSRVRDMADSVIAHAFIGVAGALDGLKLYLDDHRINLYLVAAMSNPGWNADLYYGLLREIISHIDPYGLVVGATYPRYIGLARRDFPDKVIISPGIGVQGANPGDAVCSGATYEIVGRSIYQSRDPVESLKSMIDQQNRKIRNCSSGVSNLS